MKIQQIAPCNKVTSCKTDPKYYAPSTSYGSACPTRTAAIALQKLEQAYAEDKATHEANLPAMAANQEIIERVTALMAEIGMPSRFSERDLRSRSRFPKSITHDAGYLTDLRREVKTSDGWDHAQASYERLLADYRRFEAEAAKQKEQADRHKEREHNRLIEQRKADMALAAMLLRYDLPIDASWEDVLEALRGRDKRLDLAVAMRQTRGDWSEGPYRVRHALDRFSVETDEDKAIANDVLDCLRDFDDGRVFRDTTWNYDVLFASVADQQLSADVQTALDNARDTY
ncbi:hypothetical protein [Stenotrophomonas maltophilia]|uniref:hypothetical protein n=1 Tax=Stenotrophomonas maltophilia TaxID=40324 RepID=UPI000F6714B5|nr:hypothetical protein [Stenotrophomonas maltophilia]RRU74122.1 hypothetical protein EGJ89_07320 [Stenotrophomonas maltophilia]